LTENYIADKMDDSTTVVEENTQERMANR
jgi:hypothetical protein